MGLMIVAMHAAHQAQGEGTRDYERREKPRRRNPFSTSKGFNSASECRREGGAIHHQWIETQHH